MRRKALTSILLIALLVCGAFAQDSLADSLNMRLEGTWEAPITLPGGDARCLAVQDTFAYITSGDTFYVIDISVPSNSNVVGRLASSAGSVVVKDSFAYISAPGDSFRVVDITPPNNPTFRGACEYSRMLVSVSDDYVATRGQLIDISDPDSPFIAAYYDTLIMSCGGAALSDTFLHIAGYRTVGEGIDAYDVGQYSCYNIADPESPVVVAHRDFGMFTQANSVAGYGRRGIIGWYHFYDHIAEITIIDSGYENTFTAIGNDMGYAKNIVILGIYWAYIDVSHPFYYITVMDSSADTIGYYRVFEDCKNTVMTWIDEELYILALARADTDVINTLVILEVDTDGIGMLDSPDVNDGEFRIFPNPFNSTVSITAPADAEIEIYDLRGNVVYKPPICSASVANLSPLEAVS